MGNSPYTGPSETWLYDSTIQTLSTKTHNIEMKFLKRNPDGSYSYRINISKKTKRKPGGMHITYNQPSRLRYIGENHVVVDNVYGENDVRPSGTNLTPFGRERNT